jgi:F0F1-type ATP synthase assembly protein I
VSARPRDGPNAMTKDNRGEDNRRSAVAYAAALSIFFSVAAGTGVGWALDRWRDTSPWFMVAGIVLGSALGLYQFVRMTSRMD